MWFNERDLPSFVIDWGTRQLSLEDWAAKLWEFSHLLWAAQALV